MAFRKNITMKRIPKPCGLPRFTYGLVVCALIVCTIGVGPAIAADNNAKTTLVYEHALPNVPGKSIKGVLVEYAPGGSSPAHTHPRSAFIYATVLQGAIRSSVNDGPVVTYRTGQSFSEMPGDRHSVSGRHGREGIDDADQKIRRRGGISSKSCGQCQAGHVLSVVAAVSAAILNDGALAETEF
jgi:quercetin dioxygenase-like cupin family protein